MVGWDCSFFGLRRCVEIPIDILLFRRAWFLCLVGINSVVRSLCPWCTQQNRLRALVVIRGVPPPPDCFGNFPLASPDSSRIHFGCVRIVLEAAWSSLRAAWRCCRWSRPSRSSGSSRRTHRCARSSHMRPPRPPAADRGARRAPAWGVAATRLGPGEDSRRRYRKMIPHLLETAERNAAVAWI